jgi:hypothetical protein
MGKIKCLICGKTVTNNNSYIGSHVKRKHNLKLENYVEKFYTNNSPKFKVEKCGFCKENNAIYEISINHDNKTYEKKYSKGYRCESEECRNKISLDILGQPYEKKTFEHIGSNSLYLSKLYKRDLSSIKYSKSKGFRNLSWTCSLENYIEKYGEKEGIQRYNDRCKKISKANTKKWYIDKYGEHEGKEKWEKFRKKKHKAFGPSKSKESKIIGEILKNNNIEFIEEYVYENQKGNNGNIDYYLPKENIIIEYYGDWWHCNPNFFEEDYYHKIMKIHAKDVWNRDKNRINYIFEKTFNKKVTILIIWSSSKFSPEYLINLINNIKNKYTILTI